MLYYIVYSHLFLALTTFVFGLIVFTKKINFSFASIPVMFYIHIHLLTAITGLFIGDLNISRFSPFQWLSVLTIFSYCLAMLRIRARMFDTAKYPMLGAYFGLCIAFAGALYPERLAGSRLWFKALNLTQSQAIYYWSILMAVVTIPCLLAIFYYNIIEFRKRKISQKN